LNAVLFSVDIIFAGSTLYRPANFASRDRGWGCGACVTVIGFAAM
jgi:hypothetical protein